ncbi:hypothetical protein C7S15_0011 [Burkholderia cepacia]|nr:hypothetical protein [Burkholderia cepacia]
MRGNGGTVARAQRCAREARRAGVGCRTASSGHAAYGMSGL